MHSCRGITRAERSQLAVYDGIGLSLYAKRLERGRFIWPVTEDGAIALTAGQMSYLLEGIDWRNPQQTWRPTSAGGLVIRYVGGYRTSVGIAAGYAVGLGRVWMPPVWQEDFFDGSPRNEEFYRSFVRPLDAA